MNALQRLSPELAAFGIVEKCRWKNINNAVVAAEARRKQIQDALTVAPSLIDSTETSVVVFGSIARNEVTPASDVDWTLLIDGPADPEHRRVAHKIAKRLDEQKLKEPGRTRIFGSIAFSHSIIHQIGGEEDSNRNTTQRILLLLESKPIGTSQAHQRVLYSIITRYFADDMVYTTGKQKRQRVPRFLLNDIIRYWRTVAVDYASKKWERDNEGWALRNVKLRMSRKLTFCAGLLCCFNVELDTAASLDQSQFGKDAFILPLVNQLRAYVNRSPLEILIGAMLKNNISVLTIKKALNAYDAFLGIIADGEKRERLDKLAIEMSEKDKIFNQARDISYEFQEALDVLFFENVDIGPLTRKYGVF